MCGKVEVLLSGLYSVWFCR